MRTQNLTFFVVLLFSIVVLAACSSAGNVEVEPNTPEIPTELPINTATNTTIPEPTQTIVEIPPTATIQPTTTDTPDVELMISFSNDVFPIVQNRCINCHGGDRIEEGLDMTTYAGILAGSVNGAVVIPGDAENSLFVELVASQKMPKRGAKLTPAMVQLFRDWVNQGALDN